MLNIKGGKMRYLFSVIVMGVLLSHSSASAVDYEKVTITGKTDKDTANYKIGEKITFTFKALAPDGLLKGYKLKYLRTGDDGKKEKGEAASDTPLVLSTTLDRPGFVRYQVTLCDDEGKPIKNHKSWNKAYNQIKFDGGAGIEIEKIKQGVIEPEDFDAFWEKQKSRLAAVPLKYKMSKVNTENKEYDIFAVNIDCAGPMPVTGYLIIPVGAKDNSLNAIVKYMGYGVTKQKIPTKSLKECFTFEVNAHGYELGKEKAYYDNFAKSISIDGKRYLMSKKHIEDKESSYLNGMALRVLRSLEFVKTVPQWNKKRLVIVGGSQAGLQGAWAAGLDKDVSKWYTSVPFYCDLGGFMAGRIKCDWGLPYAPAVNYYDPVNHVKRMKCPVQISKAGLGDYTCPPSGLAVLYNNIPTQKEITFIQGATHGDTPKDAQRFTLKSK